MRLTNDASLFRQPCSALIECGMGMSISEILTGRELGGKG
jgi:hypothetical protein